VRVVGVELVERPHQALELAALLAAELSLSPHPHDDLLGTSSTPDGYPNALVSTPGNDDPDAAILPAWQVP
jgi:hypothetical protein